VSDYNWEHIATWVQELIGDTDTFKELIAALTNRLGTPIPKTTLRDGLVRTFGEYNSFTTLKSRLEGTEKEMSELEQDILQRLRVKGRVRALSLLDLSNYLDRSPLSVMEAADMLVRRGYNVKVTDDSSLLMPSAPQKSSWSIPVTEYLSGKCYRFGIVSDNHLGNRASRLDVLDALYDIFEEEGIEIVLNAGNLVAGESRLNSQELVAHGVEGQLMYVQENYPQKEDMVTKFITGSCHEGWWAKDLGLDVGRYMQLTFEDNGRQDLQWIGHVEADLLLDDLDTPSVLRVLHPGGGTAYALTYKPQKIVESLSGGEKPAIMVFGHYHKFFTAHTRGVYIVGAGTTCDQTIWMRKQHIEAHVGGAILEVQMTPMGGVGHITHRWIPFYDSGYYRRWDYRSAHEQEN